MKIHLHIESDIQQIEIHIHAPDYNETVEQLMKKLKQQSVSNHIAGYKDNNIHLLQVHEVFSIYSDNGKVYIQTDDEEFEAKNKLYELEERFEHQFIRINKATLVNLKKIISIQSKVLGNPQIVLANDATIPVSRNYFKSLKEALGLGGTMR
ncbi:LytTR family DNA-binding domain-containing protein [Solibacillus sp. FSL H8-0523]|uniref:LytTR family DNA-binding domain-containing protein n=1 Tax=Solibacillus sp. FSL H8-0523 TaxID=2954511 RepID=UPI00310117E3